MKNSSGGLPTLKVLHVIDSLRIGGAERVLVDLCNLLIRKNVDVSVLVITGEDPMRKYLDPDIPYYKLNRTFKWDMAKLYRINKICRGYDIIHVHLRYNFKYLAFCKFVFRGKFRIVLHDHFGDIENDRRIPFGVGFFLRRERWFMGVSQPLVAWAVERVGLKPYRCFILPNIVMRRENLPEKASPSKSLKVLLVSNFRPSKNHAFAFKLFAELNKVLDYRVTLVGQVHDKEYMGRLLDQIRHLNLLDRLEIRHDIDDVQLIASQFDIAIHTAHQESGPLVLIEYLAQGLPFVAFKTGEVSTQVCDVIPDFLMGNFDVSEWLKRILFVINRKRQYEREIRDCFESLYSEDRFVDRTLHIYNHIISHQ